MNLVPPLLSVIIPARGEELTLPSTLPHVISAIRAADVSAELLVVVPDTSPFASSPPNFDYDVRWIVTSVPGKYEALRRGVLASVGSLLMLVDADVLVDAGAVRALTNTIQLNNAAAVAGRIRIVPSGRTSTGQVLESLARVGADAWHAVRQSSPTLRFALPGALYCLRREFFPADGLVVAVLDDASIGVHIKQLGGRIEYEPTAEVWVAAPRTIRQWLSQKSRTRDGWRQLEKFEPGVKVVRRELSRNSASQLRGRPFLRAVHLLDRALARVSELRPPQHNPNGRWQPDREGWDLNTTPTPVARNGQQCNCQPTTSLDTRESRTVSKP